MNYFEAYHLNGFVVIKNAIPMPAIKWIHDDISRIFTGSPCDSTRDKDSFAVLKVMADMSINAPDEFYHKCLEVGDLTSMSLMRVSADTSSLIQAICCKDDLCYSSSHSGLFFNKKGLSRLQYKWHQERSYFPDHEHGIHIWYPLFNDISVTGGPMLIKARTNKKDFAYAYSKESMSLTQLEVSNEQLTDYETFACDLRVGDAVVFDHRTVHCTEEVTNESIPRVSGIKRFVASKSGIIPCSTALTTSNNSEKVDKIKNQAVMQLS